MLCSIMQFTRCNMKGDLWNEKQRTGWKSDKPACEWEGVMCNANGEIYGLSFPLSRSMGFEKYSDQIQV